MPVKAGVIRAGARTTRRGAAETFTGVVFQDPVITAEAPSRLGGSVVTEVAPFQWTVCQLPVYVLVMAACMSAS
jgi:hypothetical protein